MIGEFSNTLILESPMLKFILNKTLLSLAPGKFRNKHRHSMLSVQKLEDRVTPSIFTVYGFGDNDGKNPSQGAGTGTFRQAIVDLNADQNSDADFIVFNPDDWAEPHTIVLKALLPELTTSVTILGTDKANCVISGNSNYNILYNNDQTTPINSINIVIDQLTLENSKDSTTSIGGGAIVNVSGNVTVTNSEITNCITQSNGGAITVGTGSVTISDSMISDCSASHSGGAVYVGSGGSGQFGFVKLNGVTISDCMASISGGAVHVGTGYVSLGLTGTVTIEDCTACAWRRHQH